MKFSRGIVAASVCTLLLLISGTARADLLTLNIRALDTSGNAITSSTAFTFAIFNQSSGGTKQWEENHTITPSSTGRLSQILGLNTSLSSVLFDENDWLQVIVAGETLSPRYRMTSFTSALSQNASKLYDLPQLANKTQLNAVNISAGTFGNGSFLFQQNLTILKNLTVGAGTFFVDQTLGRIGIGTLAPTFHLEVNGTLNVTGTLFLDGINVSQRLTADNRTIIDVLSTKANLSSQNNFTGNFNYFANISLNILNATRINVSAGISCGMINGGSDGDFCADDSAAGATNDNTTQNNLITANNATLTAFLGQKLNLTGGTLSGLFTILSVYTTNNLSLNVSSVLYVNNSQGFVGVGTTSPASKVDVSGTLTVEGVNVTGRQASDNGTTSTRIGSLETKQVADNTTTSARIAALDTRESENNVSQAAADGTKVNLTASASKQCSAGEYIDNVTTIGGVVTEIACKNQTGAADNATQAALIAGNNQTLTDSIATKATPSSVNNFTGTWNWFANITADQGNFTRDVFVGAVAVFGRVNSNNQTLLDLIAANNGTLSTRVGDLETKQTADNSTTSTRIGSLDTRQTADNATTGNRVGALETKQAADNTTITNSIAGFATLAAANNFTAPWNWFANLTADQLNATRDLFVGGVGVYGRLNSNNQTLADLIGTKLSTSAFSSENTTIQNTYATIARLNSENTTIQNTYVTIARVNSDNTTMLNALNTKWNISNANSDNATLTALLGQKLNLTGGTLSGNLNASSTSQYYGNQTLYIPASDGQFCRIFRGTQLNFTECINSTGHMTQRFGVFVA